MSMLFLFFFFFQAEDGIRDVAVTGVQTCALPISSHTRCCGCLIVVIALRCAQVPIAVMVTLSLRLAPCGKLTMHGRPQLLDRGAFGGMARRYAAPTGLSKCLTFPRAS